MTFLPGPMISPYAENSLRKHTGFTFGLNEKDIVKRRGGGDQVILIICYPRKQVKVMSKTGLTVNTLAS